MVEGIIKTDLYSIFRIEQNVSVQWYGLFNVFFQFIEIGS